MTHNESRTTSADDSKPWLSGLLFYYCQSKIITEQLLSLFAQTNKILLFVELKVFSQRLRHP